MDVVKGKKRTIDPFKYHDSSQIEASKNSKRKNEVMKQNLKNLHLQRNKWKGHNRNATCWAFYYVNDNKKIDIKFPQTMKCIIC